MINQTINQIRLIRNLDLGGFSSVWLAVQEVTQKQLAVKIIPKFHNKKSEENNSNSPNVGKNDIDIDSITDNPKQDNDNNNNNSKQVDLGKKSHFEAEIKILSKIDHPLVLGFFGDFEDEENHYICMEYLPNGSLLDFINAHSTKNGLKPIVVRRLFTELLITVEYLHKNFKIFHRDLKCENILIDVNNNIRLIDFGFSVIYDNPDDTFTDKLGTTCYTCPEIVNNVPYTPEKADVWCLGIILYAMLVGKLPFTGKSDTEIAEKVATEEPDYPNFLSTTSVDLLKKILTKNPYRRIDIDTIKTHPFLSQTEVAIISRLNPTRPNGPRQLDADILFELSMCYKVNVKNIIKHNPSDHFSSEMLIYKQLRRCKETKLVKDIIDGKIASLDQKKKYQIKEEEETNKKLSITPSSSFPSKSDNSSSYYKASPVSTPDISKAAIHVYSKINRPVSNSNLNANDMPRFVDGFVEDTIIDDDETDTNNRRKRGVSTPSLLSLQYQSESEYETDSESVNESHLAHTVHCRRRKKRLKHSSAHSEKEDNHQSQSISASLSLSSNSSLPDDDNGYNYLKKNSIRIAPKKRSNTSTTKNPKSILSLIH